jgi:S-adenosyl methyltransferase
MQHALDYPGREAAVRARRLLGANPFQFTTRPLHRVRELVAGFEFVEPGVVPCPSWRPDGEDAEREAQPPCPVAGGVARI